MSEPVTVVGIGASAGGLSPIEEFFDELPSNTGAAFVVVQHLSPHHESMMAPLLRNHTEMRVEVAEHGVLLEANRVYLIAPATELCLLNHRFVVMDRRTSSPGEVPKPIDTFFTALASEYADNAVGIVLSGTGSDGTAGIANLRNAGALTLAQDESAAFQGMPSSARQSGSVDATLPPSKLAVAVQEFVDRGMRPGTDLRAPELEVGEARILNHLSRVTGVGFGEYKPATLHRRIARRVAMSGAATAEEYLEILQGSQNEADELLDDLLIDVTQWFRDRQAFGRIGKEVAPRLLSEAADNRRPLRLWVAACSSGEEAYSLLITFLEAAETLDHPPPEIQMFATDVHPPSVTRAGSGTYTEEQMNGVSDTIRHKYFEARGADWQIRPQLRSAVTFATHNLLDDAPFTRIDFASCRNLLIYFRSASQERAITSLSFSLRLGGVLLLGSSESLGPAEVDFATIDSTWRLFTKASETRDRKVYTARPLTTPKPPGRSPIFSADRELLQAYDAVLATEFLAGVLVNQRRELVHVLGAASEWLSQPPGRPTLDVLSLVLDPAIRLTLGAVLRELEAGAKTTAPRPLATPQPQSDDFPALLGRRIDLGNDRFLSLAYVRPARHEVVVTTNATPSTTVLDGDLDQLTHLEAELAYTRENLQAALEEQETSNEELNAANEELIASNEELQSTNEELSSVNEELRTLNDEHQRRLDQVLDLTVDLEELMSATEIGVVFLAEDGTIRRFNEPARDFFRVRDQDIGRSFDDVRSVFDGEVISEAVERAFIDGAHAAHALVAHGPEPRRVAVRVSPYQLPRERSGVLIAIVDITDLEVADEERLLAHFLQTVPSAVNVGIIDEHGRFVYRLRPMAIDGDRVDPVGRTIEELFPHGDAAERAHIALEEVRTTGAPVHRFVHRDGDAEFDGRPTFRTFFPIEIDGRTEVGVLAVDATAFEPLVQMQRDQALIASLLMSAGSTLVLVNHDSSIANVVGDNRADVPEDASDGLGTWLEIDPPAHRAALASAMGGETTRLAARRIADDRWQYVTYLPLRDPQAGADVAINVVDHHDSIIELRQHRDEVARLRQELRDLHETAAADVASLAERNEDLDNFAHVAAHDLKAPIRSIRSFGELAIEELDDGHAAREHVQQVVASAKRMTMLVESLLEYAAIDRGSVDRRTIDLRDVLDDVQLDLRSEIDEAAAEVIVDLTTETVQGSPEGLRQVLTNLVNNAVKFRGDRVPRITIESSPDEGGVLIRVTDNGIGFDSTQSDRLFEPFQRLHAEPTPGSGVGLAICRRIVQRHDGRIWASTEPGVGSSFSIWLPRTDVER